MRLHPNAAIRVLRNELERLAEARRGCTTEIQSQGSAFEVTIAGRMMRARRVEAAAEILGQICVETTELEEALAILEAGFEAEQGFLPFEVAAA